MNRPISNTMAVFACLIAISVGHAADQAVAVPTGWTACPYRFAASSQRVALMLYPASSDPFVSNSKIMLVPASGASTLTDVAGKAYSISYSPTGASVLVHHDVPDGPRVSMLSGTSGIVLWTKSNDSRMYAFSATGNVIYARQAQGERPAGNQVEIFDLAGVSLRRIDFGTVIIGALVPNDSSKVVVAHGRTISAFNFSQAPMVQEWSLDLTSSDEPLTGLRALGSDRFVVEQELGHFKVMKWNGTVEYVFNPTALDAADPSRSFADYASYQPYATPLPNKLLLFRGSSDALLLNLATGTLTGKVVQIAAPQGFSMIDLVDSGRLVFSSGNQVRIRPIAF